MIKMISFDCFGVLLHDAWLELLEEYANKETINDLSDLNHQYDRGILAVPDYIREVHDLTGAPESEIKNAILVGHVPNEKLRRLVVQLKNAGYGIGLISNAGGPLDSILPENIYSLFDTVTVSYTSGCIKPEARIFEQHGISAGFELREIAFIDDRQVNADGASSVGMSGIVYTTMSQLRADLNDLGVAVE